MYNLTKDHYYFFAGGVPFYHIILIKFMKEEDNKSSLKKCIYYGFGILTPYFSILCPILIQQYANTFNTIQKTLKILYKYRTRDESRDYLGVAVFIGRVTKREAEGIATL